MSLSQNTGDAANDDLVVDQTADGGTVVDLDADPELEKLPDDVAVPADAPAAPDAGEPKLVDLE
jgi:hypothetical protein